MAYRTKTIDDLGAKSGLLKLAGERIETPTRILTLKEVEYGDALESKHLVTPILYPTKLAQFTKNFNENTLESFSTQSEVSASLEKELKDFAGRFSSSIATFLPSIPSYMTIQNGIKKTRKPFFLSPSANRKLMQAQINANYEIITIQEKHPSSSAVELDGRIENSQKFLDDSGAEIGQIMVCLKTAMKEMEFKEKLKVVADKGIKLLCLIGSSVGSYLPNLDYATKFARRNEDIYIQGSQIERIWRGNKISSLMHLAQLFSYDSFAVKLFPPIVPNKPFILVRKNAKRFDGRTLGLLEAEKHEKLHGNDLGVHKCPICESRNLDNFFETFSGTQRLRAGLNIHEFFDSSNEFQESRPYIDQHDYRNYAKSKQYLLEAIKNVLRIDLKAKSLTSWFRK